MLTPDQRRHLRDRVHPNRPSRRSSRPRSIRCGRRSRRADLELVRRRSRDARIAGDGTGSRQVAENLLSNAIKFTPAGGRVTVRVTEQPEAACSRSPTRDRDVKAEIAAAVRADDGPPRPSASHIQGTGLGLDDRRRRSSMRTRGDRRSTASPARGRRSRSGCTARAAAGGRAASARATGAAMVERADLGLILVADDERDIVDLLVDPARPRGLRGGVGADGESALSIARDRRPCCRSSTARCRGWRASRC